MANIQIYLDGVLQREVILSSGVNTVGRDPINTIQIDDPGVSGCHVKIVQENGTSYIEDNNSKNGTFLNGQRISRHRLKHGDKVAVWKYSLKYLEVGEKTAVDKANLEKENSAELLEEIDAGSTVALDLSQLKSVLEEHSEDAYLRSVSHTSESGSAARLVTVDEGMQQKTHHLQKEPLTIGRKADCDIRVGGWFAPAVAAEISHENDTYVVTPGKRGKVILNGNVIEDARRLNDGDRLSVRRVEMKFYS